MIPLTADHCASAARTAVFSAAVNGWNVAAAAAFDACRYAVAAVENEYVSTTACPAAPPVHVLPESSAV